MFFFPYGLRHKTFNEIKLKQLNSSWMYHKNRKQSSFSPFFFKTLNPKDWVGKLQRHAPNANRSIPNATALNQLKTSSKCYNSSIHHKKPKLNLH